ncbi:MAG: 3-methyl-2-oxobutanoate dehydrogenase subunit VorB [Candidatus Bipolaricaulota bacterium]|nr:MAG: 3-methyl-2-oxobutanoate dehydrogenase subunit VorB [Candidatus Bipolaricaulota bacterium]
MSERQLLRGNEAIAEAAIRAGCTCYFAYPITPQAELLEHMAANMQRLGRTFVQAESEVAAISMVYGAAATGARVMTSSSSPGISLKQEGISYLAGANLPAVIVNVVRGGPGLGNIAPCQCDYFQATKGGGHGDYHMIVLAPSTVPEAAELTMLAFDLADEYRTPVMILADGMLGQMMEPVALPNPVDVADLPDKPWATTGAKGREPNIVLSFDLDPLVLREMNLALQEKYRHIVASEIRHEETQTDDAGIVIAAYGTIARIAKSVVREARAEGIKLGLYRPITLWPFPYEPLRALAERAQTVLTVEMSAGQMWEDVRLAVAERAETPFFGELGGVVPTPRAILNEVRNHAR